MVDTRTYSACTCALPDPCGWRGDGFCDAFCAVTFPGDHFDDAADCPVDCAADCASLTYSACSCSSADPCGWQGDGYCDNYCAATFPGDHFDDPVDCCEADCLAGNYTACSCSSQDACGWAGDGFCDSVCADNFADYFDDSADCS